MMSERYSVLTIVLPLVKLLCMTIIGLLLAHPKTQFVPKATFKTLSKLVFALFMPCLIFTDLGPSISLSNLVHWWFLPVNVFISTAIGCGLGFLVAKICRPPPELFRFTVIMTAFGNTGNLPISIVSLMCEDDDNPFGSDCASTGVSYVAFGQLAAFVLVYTLVYHMMEPPLELYEVDEEVGEIEEVPVQENGFSQPLLIEAEWPGMEDKETEHCKTPFIARLFKSISGVTPANVPDRETLEDRGSGSPRAIKCLAEPRMVRNIRIVAVRTPIRNILQPPAVASLLAIIVGVIPQVQAFVFDEDGPISFIIDSLEMMAEAMVPCAMLIVGGMLAEGPTEYRLGMRTTIGIIVSRLFLFPLIGIGVVLLAQKWGLLVSEDQLYKFVLLLQYTTPSAILLGAVASLRGYAVREASALLFWQHVIAMFSLTFYIFIYFKLVFNFI